MKSGYYRSGQAARVWAISSHLVRRLCEAGLIEAQRTSSGQWKISIAEVERITREGVPEIPTSIAKGDSQGETGLEIPPVHGRSATHFQGRQVNLAGEFVPDDDAREEPRAGSDSRTPLPWFENSPRAETSPQSQVFEAPPVRIGYAQADTKRIAWHDSWMATALWSVPRDAPPEISLSVREEVSEVLGDLGPEHSPFVIRPLLDAAVAKVLRPWNQERETETAIETACSSLPSGARNPFSPTIWQSRAHEAAVIAIRKMPGDSTLFEKLRVSNEVVRQITSDFQDSELRKSILQGAYFSDIAPEERENAKEAIRKKLESLPTGTQLFALQNAREQALAPFREARKRQERTDPALRHIQAYLERLQREGEIDFENNWELSNYSKRLERRLRPMIEKELLDDDLSDYELSELIEELVDEELE